MLAASLRLSQSRSLGNLLAPGTQHKIGIIAVDYGTQWPAASERFINSGKIELWREGEAKEGGKKGAPHSPLPPLLCSPTVGIGMTSTALNGTGILDMPTAPLKPLLPSIPPPSISPFLATASLDSALGRVTWGQQHCLQARQKPLRGRRGEAESFTWSQPRAGIAASLPLPYPL